MSTPIKKFQSGKVQLSIWQNEYGYTYTFQKSYKGKDGQWKNVTSFTDADLLDIAFLAQHIKSKVIDAPKKKTEPQPEPEPVDPPF